MFHFGSLTFILVFVSSLIGPSLCMKVSFCDGDKIITLKDKQCPGGVNFGARKPDCVCISGIYRMWMDNCVVYDGFMEDGCSTLNQEELQVVGLRLTGKVRGLSNATAAVFAKKDSDYQTWSAYPIGGNGSSISDNFYTVNGEPYVLMSTGRTRKKKFICVEKKVRQKDQICRYYREDDQTWSIDDGELKITVKDVCHPPPGYRKKALKPQSCYSILGKEDSECSLSCMKNIELSESNKLDPTLASPEDDKENKLFRRAPGADDDGEDEESDVKGGVADDTISENELDNGNNTEFTGNFASLLALGGGQRFGGPISFTDIDETNYTKLSITQQLNENNFFLNRKLNHYSKLRQVGYLQQNDMRQVKPSRTFELFDLIRDIGKKACPDKYVSSLFVDQAVDLFAILHKGRNYRYTEDLLEKDFNWIKKILASCLLDTKPINMVPETEDFSEKCTDFQKVKGVCSSTGQNCTDLSISQAHSTFGKYHFVVEAAWDLIDLTQIVCFPSFSESYRMFHQWEQASEKLFTREIRKLWYNPNLSIKVYQNLLTPSAQIDMHNLEMCVEGAYTVNPSLTRLNRPSEPRRFFRRKKRQAISPPTTTNVESTANNYDVYCRKTEPDFEYPC